MMSQVSSSNGFGVRDKLSRNLSKEKTSDLFLSCRPALPGSAELFLLMVSLLSTVSSTFSWGIALAPLSLVFLAVGGIWMHRRCKQRAGKTHGLTKLRTDDQDFPSSPSQIKEMK